MNASDWEAINDLLSAALELAPDLRAAYLEKVSQEKPDLAAEALRLLEIDQRRGDSIERWLQVQAHDLLEEEAPQNLLGTEIGPYRITEELGRGGMGVVYKAIRSFGDADRPLAFKILKGHAGTLGRVGEHAMLARLDHPNIARIIDGGTLNDGTQFLVMDYVDGVPIDLFCDHQRLDCRERMQLFQQVCSAVNCAHQNLIVHCDLKPKNILVTPDGAAHLLDFGIARLESPSQDGDAVETSPGIMTLDYASPEQIQGRPLNTLSDVYSLGVLLYELLTGCRPYRLPPRGSAECLFAVQSSATCPPSRAVNLSTKGSLHRPANWRPSEAARVRKTRPRELVAQLQGDVDGIVMKALATDPRQRYSSVAELSEDIQRYIEGWPVSARRSTWNYRAARFVGRHRVGVSLAVIGALLMVVTTAVVFWQANVAQIEKEKARFQSQKAERISEFLQRILSSADVGWYNDGKAKGPNVTVREVLDEASKTIELEFGGDPELKAEIHHTIGNTYRALTLLEESERHFRTALELRQSLQPPNPPKVAESYYFLGAVRKRAGDLEQAQRFFGEAYSILSSKARQEANFPFLLADFADLRWRQGQLEEADRLARECLQRVGPEPTKVETMARVSAQIVLAQVLTDRNQVQEAGRLFLTALGGAELALRDLDSDLARLSVRALLVAQAARFDMRLGCLDEAGRLLAASELPDETAASQLDLFERLLIEGEFLARKGMFPQAEEKAALAWGVSPPSRWYRGQVRVLRGRILLESGSATEAETTLRAGLEDLRVFVSRNRLTDEAERMLAESLLSQGRGTEERGLRPSQPEIALGDAATAADSNETTSSCVRLASITKQ